MKDNKLALELEAKKGLIHVISKELAEKRILIGSSSYKATLDRSNGNCLLECLEDGRDPILVLLDTDVKRNYFFRPSTEANKTKVGLEIILNNNSQTGFVLEGNLHVKEKVIPIRLEKGDSVHLVIPQGDVNLVNTVRLDFSRILDNLTLGKKQITSASYYECAPVEIQIPGLNLTGDYVNVGKNPKFILPCSVVMTREDYGSCGYKKLYLRLLLRVPNYIHGKKATLLVQLPDSTNAYTSTKCLHGLDGKYYCVYDITFEDAEVQEFELAMIEL